MNLNKYLRYGILAGIFVIPFIPILVNSHFFFPFITFKNFTFRIVVELMLGAWAILLFRDHRYMPKFSWIFAALSLFVVAIGVADMFGVNVERSFWSNYERMEGLITHLHLFVYFLILSTFLSTERLWEKFFQTSVGVSLLVCCYSILQLLGTIQINQGGVRVDATFGNATYLAIYLVFNIFLAGFLLLRNQDSKFLMWTYRIAIPLQLFILYFTATRGAILGLIGGVILSALIIALFSKNRPAMRKAALYTLGALFILAALFMAVRQTSFVQNSPVLSRFASLSVLDEIRTRAIVWNMGYQGFKERPLLGWGQENFNLVFNAHYNPEMYNKEQWFDRTHDIILDWLVAGGIAGLIGYLSIWAALFFYLCFREPQMTLAERALFIGLFAGYFFHNIFVFDNITSYLLFFALLAYLHRRSIGEIDYSIGGSNQREVDKGVASRVVLPLIIVLTLILIYVLNGKPILANFRLIDALKPQPTGISVNLEYYKQALAYNTFGDPEITEQLATAAARLAGTDASSVPLTLKQAYYETALSALTRQIEEVPNDARYQLFAGSFLNAFGKYTEALEYLKRALALSPNKQSILTEIGGTYINMTEYAKALEVLKHAYEVQPNNSDARSVYAVAAVYAGRDNIAVELLTPIYGSTIINDDRMLRAYYTTRQYSKVIEIWKLRVSKQPGNPQFHLSLGAAYMIAGQRQNAISEIREVIRINPDFKKQGDYYISEIQAGRNP